MRPPHAPTQHELATELANELAGEAARLYADAAQAELDATTKRARADQLLQLVRHARAAGQVRAPAPANDH